MNTKRIIFWVCFIIVLVLIIWGLIVAMNKPQIADLNLGTPPEVSATDHVIGNPDAATTIIEYSDFQCPACEMFFPAVEAYIKEASSTVRFVYRHYPLPQHQNAPLAAQASEAAAKQGKFWEMYRMLFEGQKKWESMSDLDARKEFAGYAASLSLNMDTYNTDLDSGDVKLKIRNDYQNGGTIGINATPTFFVNGKAVTLQPNYESFKAGIEAAATTR